jgi:hypothetical protein
MRVNRTLLSAFAVGIVGGALMAACQTYDFEPVEPLALAQTTVGDVIRAKAARPNLMVLLDTSGSMTQPVNPSDPDCTQNGVLCGTNPPCNVNTCPTRWSEMRGAMSSFLTSSGSIARMGLTTYPASEGTSATQCNASTAVKIPLPQVDDSDTAALQSVATQIANEILNKPVSGPGGPSGGTPTSESLKFVGAQAELQTQDRDDFVLLLTDGLPNCNLNAGDPRTCTCTQTTCGTTNSLACLDKDNSVAAVSQLRTQRQIRTIVIGFGADFVLDPNEPADSPANKQRQAGFDTLNAMAVEGGFSRGNTCATNSDCGAGDECLPTKQCRRRFYQAGNQQELTNALAEIINRVGNTDPCLLKLDPAQRPSDDSLIVVYVNGESVPRGSDTWELTSDGVKVLGQTCTRILSSTDANPITLEVRAVQRK